jgi:hypothetical protein
VLSGGKLFLECVLIGAKFNRITCVFDFLNRRKVMKASREILEDLHEGHVQKLHELRSYIKELSDMTAKHGTDKTVFEEELMEAQHNAKYYESEIASIKRELGKLPKTVRTQGGAESLLTQLAKQGMTPLVCTSIGFIAGLLIGSSLKYGRSGRDREQ